VRHCKSPTSYGANRFGRRQRLRGTLNRDWQQARGSTPSMGRSNDHVTLAGISFASGRSASGVYVELRKRIAQENCARELRIKKALGKHGSQGGKDTAFDRERLEASVASHPCEITRAFGSASNLFRKLCIRARLSQTTRLPKEVVKVTTVDCGSSSAMHRQPRHRCREVMAFQKTGQ
jgi:hypothetical protein